MFGRKPKAPDPNNIPKHIAIIMDGNGRWAKRRGLPRSVGHSFGSETLRKISAHCQDLGVKDLTVYAFSTENWNRDPKEVDGIMELLRKYLAEALENAERDNYVLTLVGGRFGLAPDIIELIDKVESKTRKMTGLRLNICLNYGGRDEIIAAVRLAATRAKDGQLDPDKIDPEYFASLLYTSHLPDPELLIRPGGEFRISNFLLWQCAYTEFYFSDTLWPDFGKAELYKAVLAYQSRNRRFGKEK